MQWKLDLQLWPRDQETEFPGEACWLSQTQEDRTEQIHLQTFDSTFFWQHWHDLGALGSHWTDSQQWILCWGFKGVQEEIPSEEASTLQIGSVVFPPGQCTSPQLQPYQRWASRQFFSLPIVQTLLLVTFANSLSSEAVIETTEEMKEAVTKVIDTLTQRDFHRALQKLLEQYNKCIVARGDYFEGDSSFTCLLSIKVPIRKTSGNLFNVPRTYIFLYLVLCPYCCTWYCLSIGLLKTVWKVPLYSYCCVRLPLLQSEFT